MKTSKALFLMAGGLLLAANVAMADGESVYKSGCAACHANGVAGAPILGDKAAWESRISAGMDTMVSNAIKGFQGKNGVMPPKGGFTNLSDDDVKAAAEYMAAEIKN